jgi:hypothetical protein
MYLGQSIGRIRSSLWAKIGCQTDADFSNFAKDATPVANHSKAERRVGSGDCQRANVRGGTPFCNDFSAANEDQMGEK